MAGTGAHTAAGKPLNMYHHCLQELFPCPWFWVRIKRSKGLGSELYVDLLAGGLE